MNRFLIVLAVLLLLSFCLGTVACSKAGGGALTGAGVGAAAGALLSKNKVLGGAIGAGAGLIIGYAIGNEMDKADMAKVKDTVNSGRSGVPVSWANPDTGRTYQATPRPASLNAEGLVTRNVDLMTPDGQIMHATWVRDPVWGEWDLVER